MNSQDRDETNGDRQRLVRVALGQEDGDLLVRGAQVVQPVTREVYAADVLVAGGRVAACSVRRMKSCVRMEPAW